MESPVSVMVADLVTEDVEQRAVSTYPDLPLFWNRYVDDTCMALPPNQVQAFHAHLNSVEPSIQFPVSFQSSFGTRN